MKLKADDCVDNINDSKNCPGEKVRDPGQHFSVSQL